MQRKNSILNSIHFSRKAFQSRGFALITAIVVMLAVSTIIMFTLMQTAQGVKKTTDMYLYEQAELHTKSAIEYALFVIARDGCRNTLNFTLDTIYDIKIDMRYIYTEANTNEAGIACAEYIGGANPSDYIQTDEQNGSVLMDISVQIDAADTGTDRLRYFRRTIQKL